MVVTAQTLLDGPARHSCTSGGALLPSHRLIGSVYGTSLVSAAAAMAVIGIAVAVMATWEGAWPGGCEGMQGRAGGCMGKAGVCAVKGTDGVETIELSQESLGDLGGVEKSSFHCNIWGLGMGRVVETFRPLPATLQIFLPRFISQERIFRGFPSD